MKKNETDTPLRETEFLFKLFCQSVAEIVIDEIEKMNIERTAYGYIDSVNGTEPDVTYDVKKQGENVIFEGLENCSSSSLNVGDFVTIKYTGKNLSSGYISRRNKRAVKNE